MSANFKEIERKYLVWPVSHEKLAPFSRRSYKQGYVITGDTEVRIRTRTDVDQYYLAVKRGLGYVREEVEIRIPIAAGHKLMEMAGERVLTKTRYDLPNGWVLDELHGPLEGMWIAEIEQENESVLTPFLPEFVQIMFDVTDKPAFKTQRLVEHGS